MPKTQRKFNLGGPMHLIKVKVLKQACNIWKESTVFNLFVCRKFQLGRHQPTWPLAAICPQCPILLYLIGLITVGTSHSQGSQNSLTLLDTSLTLNSSNFCCFQ